MSWIELSFFRDARLAKLDRLRRAAARGLEVPPTVWRAAAEVQDAPPPPPPALRGAPCIVRSAAPGEDGHGDSRAGRYLSLALEGEPDEAAFRDAVRRVAAALPRGADGRPEGAVFVQPLVRGERAGVAFFDGFWFERTTAPGDNRALTAGAQRGEVTRGHLGRGDAWSRFLSRVHAVFRRDARGAALDLEFVETGGRHVLLQVRPAAFAVARNPTLSLANHREILGDPPSPWIASVLGRAGARATGFFAELDPEVARWDEPYALELGGRAWMNFSFFFRLMDRWGLPRTFVTEGVGGASEHPADARPLFRRMLRSAPTLVRLQLRSVRAVLARGRALRALDAQLDAAHTLPELFAANVAGLELALRTNFAIGGVFSGVARVRRALGVRGRARVVTEDLMDGYEALRALPRPERAAALDAWLARHGHRGPLESDPARPRFAELRSTLLADLESTAERAPAAAPAADRGAGGAWFWIDRAREAFRDDLMRRWVELRARLLAEGRRLAARGALATAEDVFLLRGEDLADERSLAVAVERNRTALERARAARLPDTADRETLRAALEASPAAPGPGAASFPGIPLGDQAFEGRVRRARELQELLEQVGSGAEPPLDARTVLVVPALEPSWAVVFGRVGAVVAELGGELSHASILLREAKKPALVNCAGVFDAVRDGERVRLDPGRRRVERLGSGASGA